MACSRKTSNGAFFTRRKKADDLETPIPSHNEVSVNTTQHMMDAFEPVPPTWTQTAVHAYSFTCPTCHKSSKESDRVWINRRSPVFTEDYRKKWQEFYHCQCGQVWWAWSNERPPGELGNREDETRRSRFDSFNPFDDF